MPLTVAVCQFAAGSDSEENAATCVDYIQRAAQVGADLAVLPEVSMFFDPKGTAGSGPRGQQLDGPFATRIAEAAASASVTVLVGMLEAGPAGSGRDYNTLLAVGPDGQILGTYRKIHLYDAFGFKESDIYLPGEIAQPLVLDVAGVKVGALTCYDLRFPEAFRWVTDAGAEVIALPAAWIVGPVKEHHWATLLAARAIENTVFLAAAGQTGPYGCGQSRVVDPMGVTLSGIGERPGIAVATVETARIDEVRAVNPSLANRRFTVSPVN